MPEIFEQGRHSGAPFQSDLIRVHLWSL